MRTLQVILMLMVGYLIIRPATVQHVTYQTITQPTEPATPTPRNIPAPENEPEEQAPETEKRSIDRDRLETLMADLVSDYERRFIEAPGDIVDSMKDEIEECGAACKGIDISEFIPNLTPIQTGYGFTDEGCACVYEYSFAGLWKTPPLLPEEVHGYLGRANAIRESIESP